MTKKNENAAKSTKSKIQDDGGGGGSKSMTDDDVGSTIHSLSHDRMNHDTYHSGHIIVIAIVIVIVIGE